MHDCTIHRYTDIEGRWRWRLVDASGHVIASTSETFETADALTDRLSTLRACVSDLPIHAVEQVVIYLDQRDSAKLIDREGQVRSEVTIEHTGPAPDADTEVHRAMREAVTNSSRDTHAKHIETHEHAAMTISRDMIDDAPIITGQFGLLVCHEGHDDEWRWTWFGIDGPVCESGEGYASPEMAIEHATGFISCLPAAEIHTWG